MSTQIVQPQILQLLPDDWPAAVPSKIGTVPSGCTLAHQQQITTPEDCIVMIAGAPSRPPCLRPVLRMIYDMSTLTDELITMYEGLSCSLTEASDYELSTRKQSACPEWQKLREARLTASKFKQICSRRKDFGTLAQRLITGKTLQTSLMRRELELEPTAAEVYARNLFCAIAVCPWFLNRQFERLFGNWNILSLVFAEEFGIFCVSGVNFYCRGQHFS